MRALSRTPLFTLALLLVPGGACGVDGAPRPNIVLLVSDDQDYEHLGFLGSPCAHTPNLDRMAEQGVVFTTGYAQPRCRPSLACLLSGRWPHQSGIYYNDGPRRLSPQGSLPGLLRDAGYATYAGGKYWEGDAAAMGFMAPAEPTRSFVRQGQDDLFAFIEEHAGKRPLFVWWAPAIPHMPHDAPARYRELDCDEIPLPAWFDGDPAIYRALERDCLAMGAWFDDGVGALVEELARTGILEDTLFVFLIDNGWSNGLVAKGSPYEKGVRTPIVFSRPGHLFPQRLDELVSTLDVYPTVLDYAGIPVPATAVGRSLRPYLEGGSAESRRVLCGAAYPRTASEGARPERDVYALYARDARWKYVRYVRDMPSTMWRIMQAIPFGRLERRRGEEELYDLAADPYERVDLSQDPRHRSQLTRLREEAYAWWRSSGGGELEDD